MSHDITDRLRAVTDTTSHEAAAEIERLRGELAAERESNEQYKRSHTDLHKLHCDAVAENARLREALEPFANAADDWEPAHRARAVLGAKP